MENHQSCENQPCIIFNEHPGTNGTLGEILLNNPKILNCLNLEMVTGIREKLLEWQKRDEIKAVFIHSELPKAFCAGGDVKSVVLESKENKNFAYNFFKGEYGSDYLIHKYKKPIVAWGEGIVMGGGIGLINGASHKIVTPDSTLAMPEVTIGFFPDVGGSHFLNKLPDGVGLFLGWTGARLNAADAFHYGFTNYVIDNENKPEIFEELSTMNWKDSDKENQLLIDELLNPLDSIPGASNLLKHQDNIQNVLGDRPLEEAYENMIAWSPKDKWLQKSLKTFETGSPTSLHVIYEQLEGAKNLKLHECFLREWNLAVNISHGNEFYEGVRALLIDKDKSPKWHPPSFEAVDKKEVLKLFEPVHETQEIREIFTP